MPSRIIRPGPHFRPSLAREAVRPGSPSFRAIGRIIRALADETSLPGASDLHGVAPTESEVGRWADARVVPRTGGLWLWYRADAEVLELVAVSRR